MSYDKIISICQWLCITLIVIQILILCILLNPLERKDKSDCQTLQEKALTHKDFLYSNTETQGFYITESQKEMCDFYNISIDAPVKKLKYGE
jgi:hypothetical protein